MPMSDPTIAVILARVPSPPGPLWLVSRVANYVDRTPATLRRWRRQNRVIPTWALWMHGGVGSLRMPLYDDGDVQQAADYANEVRPGPAPGTGGRPPLVRSS